MVAGARVPRVDEADAEVPEVPDVPGRHGCPPRERDAGDLHVPDLDRSSDPLLSGEELAGGPCGGHVEVHDPAVEVVLQDLREGVVEGPPTPGGRQALLSRHQWWGAP
jgi:hypothetical protein